jgi:hypothetical protein
VRAFELMHNVCVLLQSDRVTAATMAWERFLLPRPQYLLKPQKPYALRSPRRPRRFSPVLQSSNT